MRHLKTDQSVNNAIWCVSALLATAVTLVAILIPGGSASPGVLETAITFLVSCLMLWPAALLFVCVWLALKNALKNMLIQ